MKGENRLHPRLLVHMPGEFRARDAKEWETCTIRDLSAGGATLLTSGKIPVQAALRLRFSLADESPFPEPIEVETLVLRCGSEMATGGNIRYLAALHFLDMQGMRFERLRRYIFERHGSREEAAPERDEGTL